ncbi:hypothetical protein M408DRAFT_64813 [Serendipita vermifera MAFF 305830]|uniref:F-box domain-containing protein n=1 Tax=Serendipita vermifera MAFF 305830 TaxID=933852 RepID=A0A0C2WZF7_SERVB|nr:hypothetical protein M408DRAFT_64813 [Serendipita vermifera MAFF 305830]
MLAKLPVELMNMVVCHSSFTSASTIRLLNQRTKELVDSCPEYKNLVAHAPSTMASLVYTGVANHFTVFHLFGILCVSKCSSCANFAAFIWLPECKRVCVPCVRKDPAYMPMTVADATIAFGLGKKTLETIPIVKTLPGEYGLWTSTRRRQMLLLSEQWARDAALLQRVARRNALGCANKTLDDISRYMATAFMPVLLQRATGEVSEGVFCTGCRIASENRTLSGQQKELLIDRREQSYSPSSFLLHFKECLAAQQIWKERSRSTQ